MPSSELQQVETRYPSLQIHGFGDVDFSATDQKGSNSGFNMGQFVLHFESNDDFERLVELLRR